MHYYITAGNVTVRLLINHSGNDNFDKFIMFF